MIPSQFLRSLILLLALGTTATSALAQTDQADAAFDQQVQLLNAGSFVDKAAATTAISDAAHPRAVQVLGVMLQGQLHARQSDGRVMLVEPAGDNFRLVDAATGQALGLAPRSELTRITVNNRLRRQLTELIDLLSLRNPDPALRLQAALGMMGSVRPDNIQQLQALAAAEDNAAVRGALEAAIALAHLAVPDLPRQLAAVELLAGRLEPGIRGQLAALARSDAPPELLAAANAALASIEQRIKFYDLLQTLFFGLSMGSVLVLAAIGLAITFGVMGVINMAHGELIMIGAYTTYVVQLLMPGHIEYSLLVAVPAAFLVAGLVGVAIERGVIRFLYGRPLETLLATFGISLILQQLVRSIFSPLNRAVITPQWMSGTWQINPVLALTYNRLYILLFSVAVFAALILVIKRTSLGLKVRAVTQNRAMARAVGVRTAWVDALTFGLGSGVAGVAGVALSQLTNVGPNLGQAYIIDSFMVVVFGGVGNLFGTLVAGLSLGVVNQFLEPWTGAVLAKIVVLVFIILFIQRRPRGLFPQKGRGAEA